MASTLSTKQCATCGSSGPFPKNGGSYCKACKAKYQREWRKKNIEKVKLSEQKTYTRRKALGKIDVWKQKHYAEPENREAYKRLWTKHNRLRQQKIQNDEAARQAYNTYKRAYYRKRKDENHQ